MENKRFPDQREGKILQFYSKEYLIFILCCFEVRLPAFQILQLTLEQHNMGLNLAGPLLCKFFSIILQCYLIPFV